MNIGIDVIIIIANKSFIDVFILNAHIQLMSTKKKARGVHEECVSRAGQKRFRHIRKGLSINSQKKKLTCIYTKE
jgi:hypothetical protein